MNAAAAMLLAFALPGAGHFYLGRRGRALAFFAIIAFLFVLGLLLDGRLYLWSETRGRIVPRLAAVASMGSGALYFVGSAAGPPGSVRASTFEYGRMFTLSAGLMNLLLVLDCYDIARGRKR